MKDRTAVVLSIVVLLAISAYLYWKHEDCASQGLEMVRTMFSIGWSCGKVSP